MQASLDAALNPASVAIIGASDNPHKVGGRPLLYLQRYGYRGAIYPINPARSSVQGLRAFARIADTPQVPDLAIIAIAGDEAVGAVEACAARGVKVAVVMTSGFAETGEAGARAQARMAAAARGGGMRLIGPNCQGLANFATGMVANFSTIFHELEGRDWPVAIVSQSGANSQELVRAAELYLGAHRPHGGRLAFVSNSGASCVMAADQAERRGIPLAPISASAKERLRRALPAFAALDNPIDVTGALLSDSGLLGAVLPIIGDDAQTDLLLIALPVAGAGYDVPRFARDLAQFQQTYPITSAAAAPQAAVRQAFADAGIATFAREGEAMDALAQLADHAALLRRAPPAPLVRVALRGKPRFLSTAESLALIAQAGLPVIEHRLCRDEGELERALEALGADIVLKACSPDLPHKSDHGLVAIGAADPRAEFRRQRERCLALGARFDGVIAARRARGGRELALGARLDPHFGPVLLVGAGGMYLEALKDYRLLLAPCTEDEVAAKLGELRIAPLLGALRGQPPRDVRALARMAVKLGEALIAWDGEVAAVDLNPVMVFDTGAIALDALVEKC